MKYLFAIGLLLLLLGCPYKPDSGQTDVELPADYTIEYSEGSCNLPANCVYAGEGCGGGHGICTNEPAKYEGMSSTCDIVPKHPTNNNYSCTCIEALKKCGWVKSSELPPEPKINAGNYPISTDKQSYSPDEKINFNPDFSGDIYFFSCQNNYGVEIQRRDNGEWARVPRGIDDLQESETKVERCVNGELISDVFWCDYIAPNKVEFPYAWDQKEIYKTKANCSGKEYETFEKRQVKPGKYRAIFKFATKESYEFGQKPLSSITEFEITGGPIVQQPTPKDDFDLSKYPYTIPQLSIDERQKIMGEFLELNSDVCGKSGYYDEKGLISGASNNRIDESGFIDNMSCTPKPRPSKIPKSSEDEFLKTAKDFVMKNSKFFGVVKLEDLDSAEVRHAGGREVIIDFFPKKKFNGLDVESNEITIRINNALQPFVMQGHFWPDVQAPTTPKIPLREIIMKYVGKEMEYADFAGRPIKSLITEDDLPCPFNPAVDCIAPNEKELLVILPHETGKGMEFRLAWKFLIGSGLSWTIWADAISGEELMVQQNFMT